MSRIEGVTTFHSETLYFKFIFLYPSFREGHTQCIIPLCCVKTNILVCTVTNAFCKQKPVSFSVDWSHSNRRDRCRKEKDENANDDHIRRDKKKVNFVEERGVLLHFSSIKLVFVQSNFKQSRRQKRIFYGFVFICSVQPKCGDNVTNNKQFLHLPFNVYIKFVGTKEQFSNQKIANGVKGVAKSNPEQDGAECRALKSMLSQKKKKKQQ